MAPEMQDRSSVSERLRFRWPVKFPLPSNKGLETVKCDTNRRRMKLSKMNDQRIKLLLVEDDNVDHAAFARFVRDEGLPYDYARVPSISEVKEILQTQTFDVALVDFMLADGTAFDLFDIVPDNIPIVIVTGRGDEEVAVRAMKAGASDYLIKDPDSHYLKTLHSTVENAIKAKRAEEALREAHTELERRVVERTAGLSEANQQLRQEIEQRKRVEEALRTSEEKLKSTLRAAPVGIGVVVNRVIKEANDYLCRMTGYSREELLDANARLIYPTEEDFEFVGQEKYKQIAEKGTGTVDTRWKRKDGKVIEVLLSSSPIDPADMSLGVTFTSLDVTDLKKAEKALRQSQEMLSLALEGANLGIWDWDLITGKAFWAERNHRALGYEPGEVEPNLKNWKKLIHTDDWSSVSENLNLHMEGKLPMFEAEYRMLNKSGSWQWMQARGKAIEFDAGGKPIRITGVVADTTDRKKAEEALRESEERYRDLVENIEDLICTHDLQGNLLFVNQAPAKVLGYAPADMVGTNLRSYLVPAVRDRFDAYLAAIRSDGRASGLMLVQTKRGEQRVWEYRNTMRKEGPGAPIVRGLARDITERKKAEEEQERLRSQLLQAQKMEAIGTLAGGIAHDFNNLLTIINGYAEMILMDKTEDDPIYADLKKILETGLKGADMVRRLLGFSKNAPISLQRLDLNLMVQDSVSLMKRTFPKMIEIETILAKDAATVNADAVQVEQVLMNMCINARDAMPDGGHLRIETRNITVDEDYCSLHVGAKPGRYVLFEVSDTGTGMSQETMDRVFEPFFTTKGWDFRKGTGLGLSVSKGVVEQHGGWITCRSELAKGTTFTVYFPAIKDSPTLRETDPAAGTVPGAEKILLVDDEEYVRDLGKRILEHAGFTVITAANGKEALEIYSRERSNIALVVLDLIMPQMSGGEMP